MESFRRILALIRKELLAILKDPRSRFTVLGPPIIQTLIFGYAATYDLNQVRYAVYDQDRSEASRQFLADMDGSGTFRRVANLRDQRRDRSVDRQQKCSHHCADRTGFRAAFAFRATGRCAGHSRWAQFQHGRDRAELYRHYCRQLQRKLAAELTAVLHRPCKPCRGHGTIRTWRPDGTWSRV